MREGQPNSQAIAEALPQPITSDPLSAPDSFLVFEPRNARQREAAQLIESGVQKLLEDPRGFFQFAARFHQYSLNNQILILQQFPGATRCASRDTWGKMGRQVAEDEARNGIKIYYPMFHLRTFEDPDTGEERTEKRLTGFGVGNTFDISQTEGEPLPPAPTIIEELGVTEGAKDVDRRLAGYLLGESVRMAREPIGPARGRYKHPNDIVVNVNLPYGDILTTKTLMHEASHWAGEHRGGDRRDIETVAEASAFIAMSAFGMDTSEYSFAYVADWAESMMRLRQNLDTAKTISHKLIVGIEGENPEVIPDWL